MTVSANRKHPSHRTMFSPSKRTRRFWGSMAAALRETRRRPGRAFWTVDAARRASFAESWGPSAAA
jgi:hypothetical protein